MAQPTGYTPATDFSDDELNNVGGRSTVRTANLDAEFAAIELTLDTTLVNLALNQRDDGEIRDARVKLHTLSTSVLALFAATAGTPRGAWVTATAYVLRDVVTINTNTYICCVAHTSGTFATDLAAVKWLLITLGSAPSASGIPFTPTATIAAANVQAAIDEADTENRALSAAAASGAAAALAASDAAVRSDIASVSATTKGAGMVGLGAGQAYGAGTTGARLRERVSITDSPYLAAPGNTNAANKVALQAAITAGHRCIVIPAGINYGYKITDSTTWPSFTGVATTMMVIDEGTGNSYAGYPTAYDGQQTRVFTFTPQTTAALTFTASILAGATSATLASAWAGLTGPFGVTFSNAEVRYVTLTNGLTSATWTGGLATGATASATYVNAGQHDGNSSLLRGAWHPNYNVSNDADYTGQRTAFDNRRAGYAMSVNGVSFWELIQGTLIGPTLTNEEMSNLSIQKFAASGDTLGSYAVMTVERKTGNISWSIGANIPIAHHEFGRVPGSPALPIICAHSDSTTADMLLRDSVGAADDVILKNVSGEFIGRMPAVGDFLSVKKTTRKAQFSQAFVLTKQPLTYSTSMTINSDLGNIFQVFATNSTAFAINAPTGTLTDGQPLTVRISNTSGGALGVATWNAAFKMTTWTQPANGFGRSITFFYDSATPGWIEQSRNAADIPN